MISLSRRYRFSASHRLHVDTLSDGANAELFGKCNNPFGHGHDYVLCVTVAGKVDPTSGLLICIERLDQMVEQTVLRVFAHRNINLDVPQFAELVPTTENVALVIAGLLEESWPSWFGEKSKTHLAKVQIQETDRNGFEIELMAAKERLVLIDRRESESVTVDG